MVVSEFKKLPIMGILRGIEPDHLEPLFDAIEQAGLRTLEITMNTPHAPQLINKAVRVSGGRLFIGAGTVLDIKSLKSALDNGATFAVMPVLVDEVMRYCLKHRIPVFPGALTPSEIYQAWQAGATMVKVFPAKAFGPEYFREIKGPFNDIELLACAGVTPENMNDYFLCGASAVTFGASVFRKEWFREKNYQAIAELIGKYIANFKGGGR